MARTKKAQEPQQDEAPRIEYVRIDQVQRARRNPHLHDVPGIKASLRRHGFVRPLMENAATGRLVAGHGTLEAVEALYREAPDDPPRRVRRDADGIWMVPVLRGVAFASERAAEEYLVADNRLAEMGWDEAGLAPLLAQIARSGEEAIAASGWSSTQIEAVVARVAAAGAVSEDPPRAAPGNVTVTYCCPKCNHRWSGNPAPGRKRK